MAHGQAVRALAWQCRNTSEQAAAFASRSTSSLMAGVVPGLAAHRPETTVRLLKHGILGCRSYQKFLKDAEAFVLYGAPKPGAPLARNMHTARSTHDLASLAGDSVPSTWADEPLHSQRGGFRP